MFFYFFEKVAIISILHDNAMVRVKILEIVGAFFNEGFFVRDDIGVHDGGENADFIEGVLPFLIC